MIRDHLCNAANEGGIDDRQPTAPDERVRNVRCENIALTVNLVDGRAIAVPMAWFSPLRNATDEQRADWQPCAAGVGNSLAAAG